jgi:hypothetical protein
VSLILEALKKLDREKQAPERGFVVVASQPWVTSTRNRGRALALVFLGVVTVAGAFLLARPRPAPTADRTSPTTLAAAAAAPPATPPTTLGAPAPARPSRPIPVRTLATPPPQAASPRARAASPPALVLQAISERDGKPIALVSDRLVREGDEFDGVRVLRIGDAEVEIEWRGHRSSIRF